MPKLPDKTKKPVYFLMGPTASGKTDLAIAISEELPCHLISVDSAQVYRNLDIGSAKPDRETLAKYPHALIDIRDPGEPYSASDFVDDALVEIRKAHDQDKIPLLVGGTMLYYKALMEGLDELPAASPEIRARIDARAAVEGWPALHAVLAKIDPESAARLHPNQGQRIQRALEVYEITGRSISEVHAEQEGSRLDELYDVHQLAIMPRDRKTLHERIELRLKKMFDEGLLEEVESLYRRGDLHTELPSIRAVGYRQVWLYLEGEYDLDEARYRALVATRNLAKRQLTWLRGWETIPILYTDNEQGRKLPLAGLVTRALNLLNL
ncbi:MAG: tRNA (adenosine(37)-N6)-dimethylallyltransferase MiaA [Porticoccaceae bacterium]